MLGAVAQHRGEVRDGDERLGVRVAERGAAAASSAPSFAPASPLAASLASTSVVPDRKNSTVTSGSALLKAAISGRSTYASKLASYLYS